MSTLLVFFAAATAIAGVLLFVRAIRRAPEAPVRRRRRGQTLSARWNSIAPRMRVLVGAGLVVGLIAAFLSGIVILVLAIPVAMVGLPLLLGKPDTKDRDLLSALETWARSLASAADTGAFTLKEVIGITRGSAPPVIRVPIDRMYARMNASWSSKDALRAFGDDLDSAWGDEVVIYLIQAAEFHAGGLTTALDSLADTLAVQVKQRTVIYNERDKPRRALVQMTVIISVVLAGIIVFSGTPQISTYATPLGEILLTIILGVFLLLLVWAKQQSRTRPEPRILTSASAEEIP